MQAAVETDENAPLRAFVVAVQEGFMLEHMEVIPNKPAENSTFSIVMFAVDHFTRYNNLQGEATSETIQEYVTWSGSRISAKQWWCDVDVRQAAITWIGSGIKVDALQRATHKQEALYQKWMSQRKEGDVEPPEMTMLSIARLRQVKLYYCLLTIYYN